MKHPCIFRALPAPVILHLLRIWAASEACSVEDCLSCAAQQPDAGRHPGIQLGEAAGRGRLPWINCFSHEPREDPNAAAAGLPGQRLAALGAASVCRVHNGLQAGATWQALLARHVQLQSALQATNCSVPTSFWELLCSCGCTACSLDPQAVGASGRGEHWGHPTLQDPGCSADRLGKQSASAWKLFQGRMNRITSTRLLICCSCSAVVRSEVDANHC